MIILDWNDDFDDYSDQRRAWPTGVGVPPRSPSSSRPGPMDLLRLGEIWKIELKGNLKILQREGFSLHKSFFLSDLGLPTQPEAPNPYNQGTWEMILTKSLRLGEPDFFLLHCLKGHSYEYKDFLLGCRPSSQLHESGRDRNSDMRWCCRRVAFIILEVSVLVLVLVVFFSPGRRLWSSWTTAWPVAANSTGRTQMICSTGNAAKHLIILPISAWFVKSFDPHRKWTILTGAGSCGGRGSCSIGRRRSRWQ